MLIVKKAGAKPRKFVGGYTAVLLDTAGNLLKDGAGKPLATTTKPDGQQDNQFTSNCIRDASNDNPIPYNGKIDANDAVRAGTKSMLFRFVKSVNDLTPLSENYTLNFGSPTQYWMHYGVR